MLKSIAAAAVIALSGGGLAGAQDTATGAALIEALMDRIPVARPELAGRDVATARGALAAGATTDHSFPVDAGRRYSAIGVCDEGCSDLNMTIVDAAGQIIGADNERDDVPVVNVQSAQTGSLTIRVLMAGCAAERCHYGVKVYGF